MKDIIIAIDEGTTNCKAVAIDLRGNVLAIESLPLTIDTPNPGWVEQDGLLIIENTFKVLSKCVSQIDKSRIAGIGISNQRETSIGWFKDTGKPIAPAMTWQCSRSSKFCEELIQNGYENVIKDTTGLPIATLFAASKMRWLLDNIKDARELAALGKICLGTIDSWLLYNLTAGKSFYCDFSNASRTQLLDLKTGNWDPKMLEIFGISIKALPQIKPSCFNFGVTKNIEGVPDNIPILSMIGDSHAALYGHCLGKEGFVKTTYGTGSSVMAPILKADMSIKELATTVSWHDGEKIIYGIEGNIAHTGDALLWMGDVTNLDDFENKDSFINNIEQYAPSNLDVYFVPMLTGAGAPWWNNKARGMICGLTRGVSTAHLIRAALESIAYQINDVIDFMKKSTSFSLNTLMVDGGPTKNDWLMQFQADLLGCKVSRSNTAELSAIGAGMLAFKCSHNLNNEQLEHLIPEHFTFNPNKKRHQDLLQCKSKWDLAVKKSLN